IITESELESKGYVDLTIDILKKFGVNIINNDYKEFIIPGNQKYIARDYRVEGDYSQGAFWIVAGLLGEEIESLDLDRNSLQGDKGIVDIVKEMNGKLEINDLMIKAIPSETKGTIIDASQVPDIIPVLSVLASLSEGETRIINGQRLRIKESDRIVSTKTELEKLGADIFETEDGLIIKGKKSLLGGVKIDTWNDHRIAMAMAIATIGCEREVIINNPEVVNKSYPNFWEDFKRLGGDLI
ncbi:MAG: 3-phosphoshikimate 1-carboxyvinyltransferase, partial [Andreesenia angusta]|nr:3-phosphoshikimate 1-carboxyvinyltransferase [Andreesenia angusta]